MTHAPVGIGSPGENLRVQMAAERTLLAWVRTGLAMMGLGFVVARFGLFLYEIAPLRETSLDSTSLPSLWVGIFMVVLGVVVNLVAAVEHYRFLRYLRQGAAGFVFRWWISVAVAVVMAFLGLALAVYLLAVGL